MHLAPFSQGEGEQEKKAEMKRLTFASRLSLTSSPFSSPFVSPIVMMIMTITTAIGAIFPLSLILLLSILLSWMEQPLGTRSQIPTIFFIPR